MMGRKPTENKMDARIAFRVPDEVYAALEQWAAEEYRPLSNLVTLICIRALKERDITKKINGETRDE